MAYKQSLQEKKNVTEPFQYLTKLLKYIEYLYLLPIKITAPLENSTLLKNQITDHKMDSLLYYLDTCLL